ERHRLGDRERLPVEARREVLALEPLHGDEVVAALDAVGDVPDDRRGRQLGEDRRLEAEALGLAQLAPREDLDGDRAAVGPVRPAIHRAHAARAREPLELEPTRNGLTNHMSDFGRNTVTLSWKISGLRAFPLVLQSTKPPVGP